MKGFNHKIMLEIDNAKQSDINSIRWTLNDWKFTFPAIDKMDDYHFSIGFMARVCDEWQWNVLRTRINLMRNETVGSPDWLNWLNAAKAEVDKFAKNLEK